MKLSELKQKIGLTRKAIDYYERRGLVHPVILENGYREFSELDFQKLQKLQLYRKLGVSLDQIQVLLDEEFIIDPIKSKNEDHLDSIEHSESLSSLKNPASHQQDEHKSACAQERKQSDHPFGSRNHPSSLKKVILEKKAKHFYDQKQLSLLERLYNGEDLQLIEKETKALEQFQPIASRLMRSFPGFWGSYLALHFAPFLDFPIENQSQQEAYDTILEWIDQLEIEWPDHLEKMMEVQEAWLQNAIAQTEQITDIIAQAVSDPIGWLDDNQEDIERWNSMKSIELSVPSADSSLSAKTAESMQKEMLEILNSSGYYSVFLESMKKLSPKYKAWLEKLQAANTLFVQELEKRNLKL